MMSCGRHSAFLFLAASALPTAILGARAAGGDGTGNKQPGDACDCGYAGSTALQRSKNTCCGDGLICSATEKTCKPAVGAECKRKEWSFGTNCAVSTYGRLGGISCQKVREDDNGEQKHRCCVSNYGGEPPSTYQYAPIDGDDSTCCSGYAEDVKWPFPSDQKYNRRLCTSKSSWFR
ncbi:unnamed protein product [Symbiodinium necroappetens]|uniref:Uncharacterized protein n=1 Tax=Symbiodinium necroappetens TaxID=1628268 RepID=A0A812T957_9DINO|nr:unnamed protein product [Symbiodinium necroappetens]|mmetsp:Transcript_121349/g.288314  ORF Transcript_121349/g.288314 Transcript_121349/m.288314 type:complete len:177 (+) Transcript_121349:77-607(+)|eukprot:CAMPEP_0181459948 /NCGR_PEP_ID=MMETSP1110-20121109/33089_1 /TAXON_ID=174948 /ORGANISM="Symbiodinium sp., Strain CCMP421" /LENGTH=176 /DNA_ID=CAMNT_0023584485 /DNA_START=63 /DNA_END=593 /DNA_ORIENTATION=-